MLLDIEHKHSWMMKGHTFYAFWIKIGYELQFFSTRQMLKSLVCLINTDKYWSIFCVQEP